MMTQTTRAARSAILSAAFGLCLGATALTAQVSGLRSQSPRPRPQTDTIALQRLLVAEDARGLGADSIAPITDALTSPDTLLRRVAARAIGRLQRPELAPRLFSLLGDADPAIRVETANALAQTLNRIRRRASDPGQVTVRVVEHALDSALAGQQTHDVAGALADALGRLPYGDSTTARLAETAILRDAGVHPEMGTASGLYWLALNRRTGVPLSHPAITLLRDMALRNADAGVRRVAMLALTSGMALDSATTLAAFRDRDPQVRRLALAGVRAVTGKPFYAMVAIAMADTSSIVRIATIAPARTAAKPDCPGISILSHDPVTYVRLTAIDALGTTCTDTASVNTLRADLAPTNAAVIRAHALDAFAHAAPRLAASSVMAFAASPSWLLRTAAATAAIPARNLAVLVRLASDTNDDVREAAIDGLAQTLGHDADNAYIAALTSRGNQVVLAADSALAGSVDPTALPALLDALDRLSAEKSENLHDPRMATLHRIAELGNAADTGRIALYVADFDTTMAATAARLMSQWTGRTVAPAAVRLPIQSEPLAMFMLAPNVELRVTMARESGGGSFTIRLLTEEAPATAARIVRLARAHYYDGHIFQRVEPDFVVQGGGPDASEYAGDREFMRDELGRHSHLRGTLGVSSRGRDTGDAQWFLNLVDNTRLDHEYTVFGEVVTGRAVAERINEGDVIAHVDVIGAPVGN
ncbi:MAG TPA: peptidylprolyl isomerase [Gemmatimonadales bacterium]|nr:peptidylprolyl isomerase [Gemmatimonadales bacterium]